MCNYAINHSKRYLKIVFQQWMWPLVFLSDAVFSQPISMLKTAAPNQLYPMIPSLPSPFQVTNNSKWYLCVFAFFVFFDHCSWISNASTIMELWVKAAAVIILVRCELCTTLSILYHVSVLLQSVGHCWPELFLQQSSRVTVFVFQISCILPYVIYVLYN